jgi:hypothetical protein
MGISAVEVGIGGGFRSGVIFALLFAGRLF